MVLLYKTDCFEGEVRSSKEGRVFWMDRKDLAGANLIWNMKELLQIFESDTCSEFFFKVGEDRAPGTQNLLG